MENEKENELIKQQICESKKFNQDRIDKIKDNFIYEQNLEHLRKSQLDPNYLKRKCKCEKKIENIENNNKNCINKIDKGYYLDKHQYDKYNVKCSNKIDNKINKCLNTPIKNLNKPINSCNLINKPLIEGFNEIDNSKYILKTKVKPLNDEYVTKDQLMYVINSALKNPIEPINENFDYSNEQLDNKKKMCLRKKKIKKMEKDLFNPYNPLSPLNPINQNKLINSINRLNNYVPNDKIIYPQSSINPNMYHQNSINPNMYPQSSTNPNIYPDTIRQNNQTPQYINPNSNHQIQQVNNLPAYSIPEINMSSNSLSPQIAGNNIGCSYNPKDIPSNKNKNFNKCNEESSIELIDKAIISIQENTKKVHEIGQKEFEKAKETLNRIKDFQDHLDVNYKDITDNINKNITPLIKRKVKCKYVEPTKSDICKTCDKAPSFKYGKYNNSIKNDEIKNQIFKDITKKISNISKCN